MQISAQDIVLKNSFFRCFVAGKSDCVYRMDINAGKVFNIAGLKFVLKIQTTCEKRYLN